MSVDYKSTVFLPKTDFPMKAGLPELEPKLLARWEEMKLFARQREAGKDKKPFILHDGPPYANGHLHIGHALNKILKDVINRSRQMMGFDAHYVPGWDCHGLPIEWKIEEEYRAKGKDKDEVPVIQFRDECRRFAQHWIGIQSEEFQRLGVMGDWERPYTTMSFEAEATIVAEIGKFLLNGGLYKGAKPVLWSIAEKTALADAEVEYHDHVSPTIWLSFPVIKAAHPALEGAGIVIWTTTPWTIPGNRAIAFGEEIEYRVAEVGGKRYVIAEKLWADALAAAKLSDATTIATLTGKDLAGTVCAHPLHSQGYEFEVPLFPADFVAADQGTGFVHIAPGHGEDDWHLGQKHGIAVPDTVGPDGLYLPHVPMFAGVAVMAEGKGGKYYFPANKILIEALSASGNLLASGKVEHSYPHSWRSKAPLIFRNTPQWFISMETNNLREKALKAIADTAFYPPQGRNRIGGMVETRPDWCVSRQRAWGVPIAVFLDKRTGEPLRDAKVLERIVVAVKAEGADAWFASKPERFLAPEHDPANFDQVFDILDVWFDSGSTHAFVLENGPWGLSWPASLYLEGSDQHRGWFHSSLLEACGTRGRAPYDEVLTHGFVLDEQGRKMSKSLGNVVSPQEVVSVQGADILRLWVVASDYSEDLRIGPDIIKQQVDVYRRLRNTLRYLLGNLDSFTDAEKVAPESMPELERWVLHRVFEMDALVRRCCTEYEFHTLFAELHVFCAVDLSAFYFDIRKDVLYCDHPDDLRRRAARTVLDILHSALTAWLAPFICFTAEEAWLARHPGQDESAHLRTFPEIPTNWQDDALATRWKSLRDLRRVVTGALEIERAAKRIGASLQASPTVYVNAEMAEAAKGVDLADLCITSTLSLVVGDIPEGTFTHPDIPDIGVVPTPSEGAKCERCWKVLPDVGTHAGHGQICARCADVVGRLS
jgi:isoleucyl-tRNA synthetase